MSDGQPKSPIRHIGTNHLRIGDRLFHIPSIAVWTMDFKGEELLAVLPALGEGGEELNWPMAGYTLDDLCAALESTPPSVMSRPDTTEALAACQARMEQLHLGMEKTMADLASMCIERNTLRGTLEFERGRVGRLMNELDAAQEELRALKSRPPENPWQPIETAPKEIKDGYYGRWVDLWLPCKSLTVGGSAILARWSFVGTWFGTDEIGIPENRVSHWREPSKGPSDG